MAVSTPIVLALALAVPGTPSIDTAQSGYGIALGNDYLSFLSRGNDRGFTSDVDVYLLTRAREQSLRVGMRHSIFTADSRSSRQRFDIGRLYLAMTHPVAAAGPLRLSWMHVAEGVYRGDLGGGDMQNFVYNWPGINGDTYGHGLSRAYPRNPRVGIAAGLGWRADVDLSSVVNAVDAYVWLSTVAQVAPLSTGVTKVEATTGFYVEASVSKTSRIFTRTELAVGRAASNDPLLALPGAYTNELGAFWGPTVVVGVRVRDGEGGWVSAFLRSARNPEGTGTHSGSGPMGWFVVEWGTR